MGVQKLENRVRNVQILKKTSRRDGFYEFYKNKGVNCTTLNKGQFGFEITSSGSGFTFISCSRDTNASPIIIIGPFAFCRKKIIKQTDLNLSETDTEHLINCFYNNYKKYEKLYC
ncbi:hypothetical protein SNE25_04825 [Mucilaginibacter sabulilitoris]|uniref:Uncharacterized protein n=1 Tax=Mucilaginibacter sabulilitoris TaxID=1173583 RepID=A0ABZ0TPL4_9SPHI|nr:hypothetical protein [Mucilaginibacter sabulilitoris]WPU94842.1 hypothetical protein SNE25_04825 [Mucilaginibacter sabulilitoris]